MLLPGILLFVCSFLAFSLSAVCGGGASFILIPMLNWVLPGAQIPAALSIGTASSSVSRIVLFFKKIRWNIVIWFVPPAIPAVWLGSWLLTSLNPFYLELILGIFLLSNLPLVFKSKKGNAAVTPMSKVYLLVIGMTAGFVSGLTGAVGLLFNRFYLRYGLSKEEIVATRAANELLLHVIKLALYASFGLLNQQVLLFGLLIALAAILSSLGVQKILPYISEQLFQRLGYSAMVISGIVMFSNASANLIEQNKASVSYKSADQGVDMKMQWQKSTFELEFEYDEGFELEYPIQLAEIPLKQQEEIREISKNTDKLVLEEVYGVNKHYYEAYVYDGGRLTKYSIYP
jgi:uncharacterized membrane protein YfcA